MTKTILNIKHLAGILVLGAAMTLMTIAPLNAEPINLITNGSFEDPVCPADRIGFWTTHYIGDSTMTGWTIGLAGIDHMCTFWQATDGERSVDLSGDGAGSISQIIPTVAGKTYDVSFDMTGNYFCGSSTKLMTVNAPSYSQQFDYVIPVGISQLDMKYEAKTFSFVAASSSSQIEFVSDTLSPCGAVIDNVILTEITPPEPEDGKVTICHKPGTPAEKTLEIPEAALKGHLKHGDTVGACA